MSVIRGAYADNLADAVERLLIYETAGQASLKIIRSYNENACKS